MNMEGMKSNKSEDKGKIKSFSKDDLFDEARDSQNTGTRKSLSKTRNSKSRSKSNSRSVIGNLSNIFGFGRRESKHPNEEYHSEHSDIAEKESNLTRFVKADKQMTDVKSKGRISPLLTDLYQITMTYSYMKQGRENAPAIFDCFFRKHPFNGNFTIFAGLCDVVDFVRNFEILPDEADFLCQSLKIDDVNDKKRFSDYLISLKNDIRDARSSLKIFSLAEGELASPRIPVIRLEGPLGLLQILETPLLNLTGYASLITTNAARMKKAAGENKSLLEFGLRRAQGPDGGLTASKFAVMGGFDGTSNCLAGYYYGLNVSGTLAHAFISSFTKDSGIKEKYIDGKDFVEFSYALKKYLTSSQVFGDMFLHAHEGEFRAFVAYAVTFPHRFLALVDTYNTVKSGVPNFIIVAFALMLLSTKYAPLGIRLDSGNLDALAAASRGMFENFKNKIQTIERDPSFKRVLPSPIDFNALAAKIERFTIVASNDLNEEKILKLKNSEVDSFGVGTNLVTCEAQPALGMVYKLAQLDNVPCIKFSEDTANIGKRTFPGSKTGVRLVKNHLAVCDIMMQTAEVNDIISSKAKSLKVRTLNGGHQEVCFDEVKTLHQEVNLVTDEAQSKTYVNGVRQKVLNLLFLKNQDYNFDKEIFDNSTTLEYPVYLSEGLFDLTDRLVQENTII